MREWSNKGLCSRIKYVGISSRMFGEFVDIDRIDARLDELWEIGRTASGGVTRLAYTEEETAAIDYVVNELPSDYEVTVDSIGNVFATRSPNDPNQLYVGSHLDTVVNGGRLDGTLGVITALEAIEAVNASSHDPHHAPTLAIFRGEESSRFGQHTIGSRGALGLLTVEDFAAVDQSDIPLWQAMQQVGLQPTALDEPTLDLGSIAGFMESHIEQGRVLIEHDALIGIVTDIRAPARFRVTVTGEYDHSGATPMALRRDALTGAAAAITVVETVATDAVSEGDIVATVGDVTAVDGAINKVCGEVTFPIDIRSTDAGFRDEVEAEIFDRIDQLTRQRSIDYTAEEVDRSEPVNLNSDMVATIETAANDVTDASQRLASGGGHDAMNFQLVGIPTGLLFAPSIDGISHNPNEETPREAIECLTRAYACAIAAYEAP